MSIEKAVSCIKKYRRFLISSHTNMEGDALGSELAFYFLVKKLGKQAVIVNEDPVPYGYEFLPGQNAIRRYRHGMKVPAFDCFVAVDCSDERRTGEVYRLNGEPGGASVRKPILNIDHHISNGFFGTVNWVDPQASCACEMVYELYKRLGVALDKKAALALYAGIVTDTGSFRYTNTTAHTHAVASELIACGVPVAAIYRSIYASIPLEDLRLLLRVLPTMKVELGGKVVWFQLRKELLKKAGVVTIDLGESVLNFGRSLKDVEVVILFKENLTRQNEVRVNFRSQGAIDVNQIARAFGGGGHKTASGCTVKGALDALRRRVLQKVRQAVYARHP
ncbi:MAG TPA: bifunctional oligoribonuclease/PAP phosphatase NrnA [Candidatus Omnitrophota bacterium]|nr:bifunctional oligoribonuclease/PAP phosphatase NrnA [Candidatus Omnitrophota bacterium]